VSVKHVGALYRESRSEVADKTLRELRELAKGIHGHVRKLAKHLEARHGHTVAGW
jgi:hypothetical protein